MNMLIGMLIGEWLFGQFMLHNRIRIKHSCVTKKTSCTFSELRHLLSASPLPPILSFYLSSIMINIAPWQPAVALFPLKRPLVLQYRRDPTIFSLVIRLSPSFPVALGRAARAPRQQALARTAIPYTFFIITFSLFSCCRRLHAVISS